MGEKINIFWGPDAVFENAIGGLRNPFSLSNLLYYLNRQEIIISNLQTEDHQTKETIRLKVEELIVHTDDYGGLNEWALLGFSNNVLENPKVDVRNVWLSNPPLKIYEDIKRYYSSNQIKEHYPEHSSISIDVMKQLASGYDGVVVGQNHVIQQVLSAIYALRNPGRIKPITLLFLGDSGVGKTETAKYIALCMKEEMVRVQFSMQQTYNASQFIFGAEHGQNSLARELIRRKSNVILLDEFDKVSPAFYNAFYQMFDEGVFVDSNYAVNVKNSIIICTTNFHDEHDAERHLGSAIYSRFSKVIKFNRISTESKLRIASKTYTEVVVQLSTEDRELLPNGTVLPFFENQIREGLYSNIRMLKNDIEDAVYFELLKAHGIIRGT